jgi:hypothetical protein
MQKHKPKAPKPMSRNLYCYFGNLHFKGMLCGPCREGFCRRLPGFLLCEHGVLHVHGQALRSDGGPCPKCYEETEAREAAERREAQENRRAEQVPRAPAEEGATTSAARAGIF